MTPQEPELWIVVTHWRRFQYYRKRNPPWIKNMTRLLHDDNYLELSGHQRAVLHGLWLEYASANAQLRLSTASLSRRLNLRVMRRDLDALNHAGFLEYLHAPRMHDVVNSRARSETETETEKTSQVQSLASYAGLDLDFGHLEER